MAPACDPACDNAPPMSDPTLPAHASVLPRRAIRSFVLRAGRLGSGQVRALGELGPRFGLPFTNSTLEPVKVFGRRAPLVIEIGFGMG